MDFGDFEIADAAILGGVMGFVEEATRDEERMLDESDFNPEGFSEAVRDAVDRSHDVQIRLLYNENPGLVEFLVKKVREERENYQKSADEKEIAEVKKEMQEELDRLEKEESDQ